MLRISEYVPDLTLVSIGRVGEGTVPLAIVVYIDGSFVKHKIPDSPQSQLCSVRQSLCMAGAGHDAQHT